MKEQKYHIYLTNQERSEIIESLIDFKNLRMQQGKYTDAVDEVLVKVIRAKKKRLKVVFRRPHSRRQSANTRAFSDGRVCQ